MKYITLILLTAISFTTLAQTGQKNFIDQNYIEVTGRAELKIVPDRIYLNIFITEKEKDKKTNITESEKEMRAELSKIGINTKTALSIKDFASDFKNQWFTKSKIVISKAYLLLVKDASTAGKVFKRLKDIGISNVSLEKLDHSKLHEYRRKVKIDAIKAAKEKAESLAVAINQTIGRAIHIKEITPYNNYQSNRFESNVLGVQVGNRRNSLASSPSLEFENISMEYSISCKFELK